MKRLGKFILHIAGAYILLSSLPSVAAISVGNLATEGLELPLNVEESNPHLSWIINSDERGVMQKAYHILVASSPEKLNAG